jgi:hypothetical protein
MCPNTSKYQIVAGMADLFNGKQRRCPFDYDAK